MRLEPLVPESKEGLKKNHIDGGMSQEDTQETLQELPVAKAGTIPARK